MASSLENYMMKMYVEREKDTFLHFPSLSHNERVQFTANSVNKHS